MPGATPTGVSASSPRPRMILVEWTAPTYVLGTAFWVQRWKGSGTPTWPSDAVPDSATHDEDVVGMHYNDHGGTRDFGLEVGETYQYRVAYYDAFAVGTPKRGSWSSVVSAVVIGGDYPPTYDDFVTEDFEGTMPTFGVTSPAAGYRGIATSTAAGVSAGVGQAGSKGMTGNGTNGQTFRWVLGAYTGDSDKSDEQYAIGSLCGGQEIRVKWWTDLSTTPGNKSIAMALTTIGQLNYEGGTSVGDPLGWVAFDSTGSTGGKTGLAVLNCLSANPYNTSSTHYDPYVVAIYPDAVTLGADNEIEILMRTSTHPIADGLGTIPIYESAADGWVEVRVDGVSLGITTGLDIHQNSGGLVGTDREHRGVPWSFWDMIVLGVPGAIDNVEVEFSQRSCGTIIGSFAGGVKTTVTSERTWSFGLDDDTHVDGTAGTFNVHAQILLDGDVHITGDMTLDGTGGGGGSGDVVGPASATDNAIVRFDSTTGKLVQNSGITIADAASGTLAGSNSGDVTLAGSPNYLTLAAQVITRALIDLASHITGRLPFVNLTAATAASKLLGRGSSGAGDMQEITLGSGLSMSGTTLSASGGGGGALDDLTDVVITTPSTGDIVNFNGTNWVNVAAPVGTAVITRKSADESVTSSTTMQDDNHLIQVVGTSQVWLLEYTLFYDGATAGDIKVNISVPASATYLLGALGPATTFAAAVGDITSTATGTSAFDLALGVGASGVVNVMRLFATVTTAGTSGNVTLRWAQNGSSGTATTVKAGSYLAATRIS